MIEVKIVTNKKEKEFICRNVLESLTNWFEVKESRENYVNNCHDSDFVAAYDNDKAIGFLYLKQTGKETVELAVMGVKQEYHRQGIGRLLFEKAYDVAKAKSYSFMQVKTVQMGKYKEYDQTNLFYKSLGFKEFEIIPLLWDEANPCQIYVMSIN